MDIISVKNEEQIKKVYELAGIIWREHYISIISVEQIEYMIQSFQSFEAISAHIKDGYDYCLFADAKAEVGYISYKIIDDALFLSKIYVLAEHRGKGYAKAAVEFLKKIAVAEKCVKIRLTVNQNNHSSIKAYEKMGFVNARVQIADIGNGFFMEDFVMELNIQNL